MTPTRRPFTDDPQSIPHSGLCDAGKVRWVPASEYEPGYKRAAAEECTCGAGLLRLLGEAR